MADAARAGVRPPPLAGPQPASVGSPGPAATHSKEPASMLERLRRQLEEQARALAHADPAEWIGLLRSSPKLSACILSGLVAVLAVLVAIRRVRA